MSIVKYKNQSGIEYAYESVSSWDPVRKQSRPKRTYLGRVDPDTGEIIKTEGKRGRPRKNPAPAASPADVSAPKGISGTDGGDQSALMQEIDSLRQQNKALREENERLHQVILSVWKQISRVADFQTADSQQ